MPTSIEAWQSMKDQAAVLVKSGFLPPSANTPEKALAIALAGRELGIGFMESIRSINVIQGKPTISPQLMLALANRTGELEDQEIDATDQRCVVTIKRKKRKAHTEEFGIKEATALGLIGKDNYNKQRATMFKWRALAANLRVTFPDVVLGLYTPEEMGAEVKETENGSMEIVQAEVVKPTEAPKAETAKPSWPHPAESSEPCITINEHTEIIAQLKRKNIPKNEFADYILKEFNAPGTSKIKLSDYPKVMEWIIRNAKEVVATVVKP